MGPGSSAAPEAGGLLSRGRRRGGQTLPSSHARQLEAYPAAREREREGEKGGDPISWPYVHPPGSGRGLAQPLRMLPKCLRLNNKQ